MLELLSTYHIPHVHYSSGLDVVDDVDQERVQEDGRKAKVVQLFVHPCGLAQ